MVFLDLTLPTLVDNLALDEALLLEAEAGGGEALRVWSWPDFAVVLGAGGVITDDVDTAAARADDVPIARRSSGGGTVLLGPGCLLFSLILDMETNPGLATIHGSYRVILSRLAEILAPIQAGIEQAGISDLAVHGKKFSGNAQQRKRRFILHHGTLLCGFDLDRVGRYLKLPPRRPEYRADRNHDGFLMNLPADEVQLRELLRAGWHATITRADWPADLIRQSRADKFDRDDWVFRR